MINNKKVATLLDQIDTQMTKPITVTYYRTDNARIPRTFNALKAMAANLEEQFLVLADEIEIHNVNPFNYNKPSSEFETLIHAARKAERETPNDGD